MTTREPTEAMRETALRAAHLGMGTDYAADARWARTLVAEIARALAEQDTAARREGFEQAREAAALVCDAEKIEYQRQIDQHYNPDPTKRGTAEAWGVWGKQMASLNAAALIRALTPEPPSEKENEGG